MKFYSSILEFFTTFITAYGLFGRCTVPNISYAIRGTCTNQMAIKETHGHRQKFVEEIDYDEIEKLEVHIMFISIMLQFVMSKYIDSFILRYADCWQRVIWCCLPWTVA